jgi:hypothetical protein
MFTYGTCPLAEYVKDPSLEVKNSETFVFSSSFFRTTTRDPFYKRSSSLGLIPTSSPLPLATASHAPDIPCFPPELFLGVFALADPPALAAVCSPPLVLFDLVAPFLFL